MYCIQIYTVHFNRKRFSVLTVCVSFEPFNDYDYLYVTRLPAKPDVIWQKISRPRFCSDGEICLESTVLDLTLT